MHNTSKYTITIWESQIVDYSDTKHAYIMIPWNIYADKRLQREMS